MVTHQVQLLTNVQKIVILNQGTIIEKGSYSEINQFTGYQTNTKTETNNIPLESESYRTETDESKENSEVDLTFMGSATPVEMRKKRSPPQQKLPPIRESFSESKGSVSQNNSVESEESEVSISSMSVSIEALRKGVRQLSRIEYLSKSPDFVRHLSQPLKAKQITRQLTNVIELRLENKDDIPDAITNAMKFEKAQERVRLRDWSELFSYGIGHFWFLISVLLSFVFNGL